MRLTFEHLIFQIVASHPIRLIAPQVILQESGVHQEPENGHGRSQILLERRLSHGEIANTLASQAIVVNHDQTGGVGDIAEE